MTTQDIYSRVITVTTADGTDTYTVTADTGTTFTIAVPSDTGPATVMAQIAGTAPDGWHPPVPPPFVPPSVTNYQIRAELMSRPAPPGSSGATLFDLADTWAHAQGGAVLQAWEYANDVSRTGDLVAACAAAFSFSSADLDSLFISAAQRTA